MSSSLGLYLIGHYTVVFASRSVWIYFLLFLVSYPINLCIDVYSYNFPNDKQVVKYLGEHLCFFLTFRDGD